MRINGERVTAKLKAILKEKPVKSYKRPKTKAEVYSSTGITTNMQLDQCILMYPYVLGRRRQNPDLNLKRASARLERCFLQMLFIQVN